MKYFFISGESSGDHISSLIAKELIQSHQAEIRAMGGPELERSGAKIVQDISEVKVMGWYEAILKLSKFRRIFSAIKNEISQFRPDIIVLVDFGSFNLRLAKWCKTKGYRVVYFIPPKVWASREHRIESLKKYCDQIIVLFPFEKAYFQEKGLDVEYYGYPLADIRNKAVSDGNFQKQYGLAELPIIALLPGSRIQEIKYMLTPMIGAVERFANHQICISQAEGLERHEIENHIPKNLRNRVKIIPGTPYELLTNSTIAIVVSGTATLECALLNIPMVVCYKTNWLNYIIAKRLIKVPFISLPNLILSKHIVPELIQDKCTSEIIYQELKSALNPAQLSMQREQFCKIYDNIYNLNTISSIAKAINNRG